MLEAGQELHQPGRLTATLQQVPPNLKSAQPRPGQTVRPQDSQGVLAEIHREQLQGGRERGREVVQQGVVAQVESLQASELP